MPSAASHGGTHRRPRAGSRSGCTPRPTQVLSNDAPRGARNDDRARDRRRCRRASSTASLCERARSVPSAGAIDTAAAARPGHVVDAVADHRDVDAALAQCADPCASFASGVTSAAERNAAELRRARASVRRRSPVQISASTPSRASAAIVAATSSRSAIRTANSATTVGRRACRSSRDRTSSVPDAPAADVAPQYSALPRRYATPSTSTFDAFAALDVDVVDRRRARVGRRDNAAPSGWFERISSARAISTRARGVESAERVHRYELRCRRRSACRSCRRSRGVIRASRSSTCARVIRKPRRRSVNVATVIAVGVANDNAQGHETTSTAIAADSAFDGSAKCQNRNVASGDGEYRRDEVARDRIGLHRHRAVCRASRAARAGGCRRRASAPVGVAATTVIGCATFNVPANTRMPTLFATRRDSPVSVASSTCVVAVDDVAVDRDSRTGWHDDAVAGADRVERNRFDAAVRFAPRRFRQQREPVVVAARDGGAPAARDSARRAAGRRTS